jgi:hypothetical protein
LLHELHARRQSDIIVAAVTPASDTNNSTKETSMAKLKDVTVTKTITHHLSAEYTNSAGKGDMQIKLDG